MAMQNKKHISYVIFQLFSDCEDGGDEVGCDDAKHVDKETEVCKDDEFTCLDHYFCIHSSWTCDGDKDCPDGSDEREEVCKEGHECKSDEIKCETGKCVHEHDNCDENALEKDNKKSDEESNPVCLSWPPVCSQVCNPGPGPGLYKCDCREGYKKDPQDKTKCKAEEGHPSLLFAHKTDIRKLSLDRHSMTSIVNTTRSSCAVDYDFKTGLVFWSDVMEEKIYSAPIDSGSAVSVVSPGVVDGLAVDWVYSHLYWTDTHTDTISVTDLTGQYKAVLVRDKLEEPRAIVLHPGKG